MQFLPDDEQEIISAVLNEASKWGLLVSVFDGEEWALKASPDYSTVQALVGATGETLLRFRDPSTVDDFSRSDDVSTAKLVGFVQFIHGNGCDVIADFSDNPEMSMLLAPAVAVADLLGVSA